MIGKKKLIRVGAGTFSSKRAEAMLTEADKKMKLVGALNLQEL